jgi:DinB family protein
MTSADLESFLTMSRKKTLELLEAIAKQPQQAAILSWRPGPGRAHIGWQLMHIAATDDRHLLVRMKKLEAKEPEYVRRFAGGSVPDDQVPTIDEIRRYLSERRQALLEHLRTLKAYHLTAKPNADAPWVYEEWFQVLAWHEAHHQGQAHLTHNLYRAAHDPSMEKVGH